MKLAGYCIASIVILTVPAAPAILGGPALPTLPQAAVDLTLPTQTDTVRNVPAGDAAALQNALNAATCGDTVVLVTGSTYTGNFTLSDKPCSGWIIVQSSQVSQLPPGTRVGPSKAFAMATIRSDANRATIQFQASAHHWRLIGLEVTTLVGARRTSLIETSVGATQLSLLPHHIIVDRCYIHADRTASVRRGISFQVAHGAVVDSYFSEFHQIGTDSQAIAGWDGPGPFLIQNNFLSAASENVLFGGADPSIPNLVPSDITIRGNHFWKDYNAWKGASLNVKNLLEFKNAQRVLVDGNVFEYSWADGQNGFAILLTPRNQNGGCNWCVVQDVTITSNLIRHAASGIETAVSDNTFVSLPTNRVLIQNNVLTDISTSYGGDGRGFLALSVTNSATRTTEDNITIDHNTVFADNAFLFFGESGTIPNFQLTNNLGTYGNDGIAGTDAGVGLPALNAYVPNAVYAQNLLLTSSGGSAGDQWPNGTLWSTIAGAQFTDYASGNYQFLSTSPYSNIGSDGKDIGVWDWAAFKAKTTNALGGVSVALTNGLVGWWKLDEGSGTSAADSAGSNTGTIVNKPTWTTGKINGALTFNGTTQYVKIGGAASLALSGSWTVSSWVKLTSLPAAGEHFVLLGKGNGSGYRNYAFFVDNASGYFGAGAPNWAVGFTSSTPTLFHAKHTDSISTGTWYHLAGVWDSSTGNLYLYLNGALVATSNTGGGVPDGSIGNIFCIGADPVGSTVANATLDDARVYNRALSASEVRDLHLATGGT